MQILVLTQNMVFVITAAADVLPVAKRSPALPEALPFNAKYVPVLLEVARERGVPFQATRLETKEEAQNAPTPVTTYALFYNGEYLTNEQMNDKRFIKLLDGMEK